MYYNYAIKAIYNILIYVCFFLPKTYSKRKSSDKPRHSLRRSVSPGSSSDASETEAREGKERKSIGKVYYYNTALVILPCIYRITRLMNNNSNTRFY